MTATIDNESLSGAWLREWLAQSHSSHEWRTHVLEQQERIRAYLEQIDRLTKERDDMLRWQVESSANEMALRAKLTRYEDTLRLFEAMGGATGQIASEVLADVLADD
jgi:hypothetical protein